MWLVIPVPPAQSHVARVFKQQFQGRRLNVTITKRHIGFAPMTGIAI
jgi:hypothetical protein